MTCRRMMIIVGRILTVMGNKLLGLAVTRAARETIRLTGVVAFWVSIVDGGVSFDRLLH